MTDPQGSVIPNAASLITNTETAAGRPPSKPDLNRGQYSVAAEEIGELFNHDALHSQDIHTWFDPNISYRGRGAIPQGFLG